MEYSAVVSKIKIRPHPDADRLQIGNVCNVDVIVGLDTKDGDLGLYFAPDGQLSEQFAEVNNLVGKTNPETGKRTGGYFGANRRVKAQKFRGVDSYGFWIPINSLTFVSKQNSTWVEGTTFNNVGGVPICNKYITPATMRALAGKQGNQRRQNSNFAKHFDTAHLRKSISSIPVGSIVYTTEKTHGTCLSWHAKITMADGTKRRIKAVKPGDTVLGFDETIGRVVSSKVLKIFDNGSTTNWKRVKFSRKGGGGNSYGTLICTPEHLIRTSDGIGVGYREAQKLVEGDMVGLLVKDRPISEQVKQLLIGMLLGDGHLVQSQTAAKVEFSHKLAHRDYMTWLIKGLSNLAIGHTKVYKSGYGSEIIRSNTRYNKFIKFKFGSWVNKANIPAWVVDEITPLALAIWYMDDGSLSSTTKQRDRANFAICAQDERGIGLVKRIFEKFGLRPVIHKSNNGKGVFHPRLRLNKDDADKFFKLIQVYVPPIMQYKLPVEYRGITERHTSLPLEVLERVSFTLKVKVQGVYDVPIDEFQSRKLDIMTETHNFFANELLVHNSGRTGYVLDKYTFKRSRWVAFCCGLMGQGFSRSIPSERYDTITGTRNTLLKTRASSGFYDNENFRTLMESKVKGLLKKGEILYYEVVGYTTSGKSIMPSVPVSDKKLKKLFGKTMSYTYGCKEKECEMYVYRITHVNEDGQAVDLSWPMVMKRCNELGVEHVPNLNWTEVVFQETNRIGYIGDDSCNCARPIVYDGEPDTILSIVEELAQGSSTLDARHIREGVVVRVESADGVRAYKEKSHDFLVLEGLVKDKDDYCDIEECS